jgi:lysophospholipid acyltransferase (LPLAT)-like uncharacterized protein
VQKEKLISWIAAWFLRAAGRTLRIRVIDHAAFFSGTHRPPVIFTYWHNRMLAVPVAYLRYYRKLIRSGERKGAVVLISRNRDARLISDVMARFGIGVVSGSSTRGGAAALLELTKCIEDGLDVNITPDGPRGPSYQLGSGVVFLSQKTGAPILPIHMEFSHCIRFNSWDRFMVPLPFSRIDMTFGKLEFVAPTGTEEEFEAERMRLEKLMQPQTR